MAHGAGRTGRLPTVGAVPARRPTTRLLATALGCLAMLLSLAGGGCTRPGGESYPGSLEPRYAGLWGGLAPGTGDGRAYVVAPDGSNDAPGTPDAPWRTIGHAVSADSPAGPGDVVTVRPGIYAEQVVLEISGSALGGHLTLRAHGRPGEVTLVDPGSADRAPGTRPTEITSGALDTNGQGFLVIDGFRIEDAADAGIVLRGARRVVVRENEIIDSGGAGVAAVPGPGSDGGRRTGADIVVTGNRIERAHRAAAEPAPWPGGTARSTDGWAGIHLHGVDGGEISDNTVTRTGAAGIDLGDGVRRCTVHHNSVVDGTVGIRVGDGGARGVDVHANEVLDQRESAVVLAGGDDSTRVEDVQVFDNLLHGNGDGSGLGAAALEVGPSVHDALLVGNTVAGNERGVAIGARAVGTGREQPVGVTVERNLVAQNTHAPLVLTGGVDVVLRRNVVEGGSPGHQLDSLVHRGTAAGAVADEDNTVREAGPTDWAAALFDPETGTGVPAGVVIGPRG